MAVQSKQAPLPSWGLAVAGSTGAVLANALVYPLDMLVITLDSSIVYALLYMVLTRPRDAVE